MRNARSSIASLLLLFVFLVPCDAASPGTAVPPPTRQQLIGAWRLMSIEYSGPNGRIPDPFYPGESVGLIVYDSSGWMSVQIHAAHRTAVDVPASRLSPAGGEEARAKAAAFDSYYAYFGTWEYDGLASVVTHHVTSALLPTEVGLSYAQEVTLNGDVLTFTVRSSNQGKPTVRKKIWRRVVGAIE